MATKSKTPPSSRPKFDVIVRARAPEDLAKLFFKAGRALHKTDSETIREAMVEWCAKRGLINGNGAKA